RRLLDHRDLLHSGAAADSTHAARADRGERARTEPGRARGAPARPRGVGGTSLRPRPVTPAPPSSSRSWRLLDMSTVAGAASRCWCWLHLRRGGDDVVPAMPLFIRIPPRQTRRRTMRAMQIIEWGKPLQSRDYPTPEPNGEQVLVRVESAGVCHSDVHIWDGYFDLGGGQKGTPEQRRGELALPMGHRIAGGGGGAGPEP